MTRLLITGARGFIGRHCLEPARAAGFEIHALASSSAIPRELQLSGVRWHVADLLDSSAAEDVLGRIKPTHVLHTAWITKHGTYWSSVENLRWVAAGTRLVEAFAANGGRRFVSVGTCAEYAWGDHRLVEGLTAERPTTFYGAMKLVHHQMLCEAARHMNFSAATGRIFFAYGPFENPTRVIPFACRTLISGADVPLSSGRVRRDFMYVSDVASGLVALLTGEIQGACNVCSDTSLTLAEIMTLLGQISERPGSIRVGALSDRPGDPQHLVGNNALLRSTGWTPQVALRDGLQLTLDWWRNQSDEAR